MSKPFTVDTISKRYTLLEIRDDNIEAQQAFVAGCRWAYDLTPVDLNDTYRDVGVYWRKDNNGCIDMTLSLWVAVNRRVETGAELPAAATSAEIHAWVVKNLADLTPSLATPDNLLEAAVRLHVYADRLGFDLTAALTDHVRGGAERSEAPKHTPTPEEQYAALTPEERAALPPEALPGGWY